MSREGERKKERGRKERETKGGSKLTRVQIFKGRPDFHSVPSQHVSADLEYLLSIKLGFLNRISYSSD